MDQLVGFLSPVWSKEPMDNIWCSKQGHVGTDLFPIKIYLQSDKTLDQDDPFPIKPDDVLLASTYEEADRASGTTPDCD